MAEDRAGDMASLIAAIHATPRRGVVAVTGGGANLLGALLATPGASATVLEAQVPYSQQALREFLGAPPSSACSEATARALAMRSFLRARSLGGDFGFAIAAALATTRPRRGSDRAHLAFQDAARTCAWTLPFEKSAARSVQEDALAGAGLGALATAMGVRTACLPAVQARGGRYADVVLGSRSHVAQTHYQAVLPGAFNPLHAGHRAMRAHAARRLGRDVGFELCVVNVDKPPLDYVELERRLAQFAPAEREVVVTRAPTFVAKARALGGVVFVVGADTLARVGQARYYGGAAARDEAIAELAALGCRFLVYGRRCRGVFQTVDEVAPPPGLAALCVGVPEREFRCDVSSTALRSEAGA